MSSTAGEKTTGASRRGYFDLDYFRTIQKIVESWRAMAEIPTERIASADEREAATRLLYAEARLLDGERLDDWLALFTDDCAYWLPADSSLGDPTITVSWELNDRRRLEERVERLQTGKAYSQAPPTRAAHLYSNIEVMKAEPDHLHVLCSFFIQTNFAGHASSRAGWNGYILRKDGDKWRIALKRIGMYDADMPQDNNSFTL